MEKVGQREENGGKLPPHVVPADAQSITGNENEYGDMWGAQAGARLVAELSQPSDGLDLFDELHNILVVEDVVLADVLRVVLHGGAPH